MQKNVNYHFLLFLQCHFRVIYDHGAGTARVGAPISGKV